MLQNLLKIFSVFLSFQRTFPVASTVCLFSRECISNADCTRGALCSTTGYCIPDANFGAIFNCVPDFGQCGGNNYLGPKSCCSGGSCVKSSSNPNGFSTCKPLAPPQCSLSTVANLSSSGSKVRQVSSTPTASPVVAPHSKSFTQLICRYSFYCLRDLDCVPGNICANQTAPFLSYCQPAPYESSNSCISSFSGVCSSDLQCCDPGALCGPSGPYCQQPVPGSGLCRSPTGFPSRYPTCSPTTKSPSKFPTPYPLKIPTKYPTYMPKLPTKYPTPPPTAYPVKLPTKCPTFLPTAYPVKLPTKYPSPLPTTTKYPTPLPTATKYPTCLPTSVPVKLPTKYPTPLTSRTPSKSLLLTNGPTRTPSKSPNRGPFAGAFNRVLNGNFLAGLQYWQDGANCSVRSGSFCYRNGSCVQLRALSGQLSQQVSTPPGANCSLSYRYWFRGFGPSIASTSRLYFLFIVQWLGKDVVLSRVDTFGSLPRQNWVNATWPLKALNNSSLLQFKVIQPPPGWFLALTDIALNC